MYTRNKKIMTPGRYDSVRAQCLDGSRFRSAGRAAYCFVIISMGLTLLGTSCPPVNDLNPDGEVIPAGNNTNTGGSHPSPHTPSGVPGDLDGDNLVTESDATALVTTLVDDLDNGPLEGDMNGDGVVNGLDIQAFVDAYLNPVIRGACCSSSGTCTIVTTSECTSSGGAYRGDSTTCATPCATSPAPQISGVSVIFPTVPGPYCNSTGSQIELEISGSDFAPMAVVKLHQDGQQDRSSINVGLQSTNLIHVTFSLAGATAGQWRVIVVNPDDQSATSTTTVEVMDCF